MKLRWPRFSMRSLLIAMLVVGAILGIVGRELVRLRKLANAQRAIMARLESKGTLVGLQLGVNRSYAEPILEVMEGKQFPDIEGVHLPKGTYETADLEEIARIDGLRSFSARKAEGNDSWLAAIAKAPRLTSVWVHDDTYTAEGAHCLAQSDAPLESVTLWGVPVDDEYLRLIVKQPELRLVGIQGEGITTMGLAELRNAKKLQFLGLQGGRDLGAGLAQLKDHPNLKTLGLSDLEWTAEDLASLQHLSSIASLSVSSSKPLPKGILRAASAMPNLKALCLRGDFDAAEPIDSLPFPCLQTFVTEGRAYSLDGLMSELGKCPTLTQIATLNTQVSERELEAMGGLNQLSKFSIGGSPSKEAIQQFQKSHPSCTYIDAQWGEFQPRLTIHRLKMGSGSGKQANSAPVTSSGS